MTATMTELSEEQKRNIEEKRAATIERRRQIVAEREARSAQNPSQQPPPLARPQQPPPVARPQQPPLVARPQQPQPIGSQIPQGARVQQPTVGVRRNAPVTIPQPPQYVNDRGSRPMKEVKVKLTVMDEKQIKVEHIYNQSVVDAIKSIPPNFRSYDPQSRQWFITFNVLEVLKQKLAAIPNPHVLLEDLPNGVKKIFADEIAGKRKSAPPGSPGGPILDRLDKALSSALFPFQQKGVIFGIEKQGRVLIADEMGLGKTVQALGIALYYRNEWPLLVVCPASVKPAWRSQIAKFVPSIPQTSIHLIEKEKSPLPSDRNTSSVIIASYDIVVRRKKDFLSQSFYVVIFDESHMLKSRDAVRTKVALELSTKASRVILLSGTPAPSRPSELFTQIRLLDRYLYPNFEDFGKRYCEGFHDRYGFRTDGSSNEEELNTVLGRTIMIRRLKKDVLTELPEKRRELVFLRGDSIDYQMESLVRAREACELLSSSANRKDHRFALTQYYHETAIVKSVSVAEYIVDTYFYKDAVMRKILIFGHHQIVLDNIGDLLKRKAVEFVRIDGQTSGREREQACAKFQDDNSVQVALLSIKAAGTGITLTAATRVVFAELHWNPMDLMQAEDRAHRYGQKNSVLVQYMLAKNTADDYIWATLEKKLNVLSKVNLNGSDDYKTADKAHRDLSNNLITQYFDGLAAEDVTVTEEDLDIQIIDDRSPEPKRRKT